MAFDVKDKIALVTGANRGIGKAIVTGLLEQNARKVYLAVRNVDSVKSLLDQFGGRVAPLRLDLEDAQSIVDAAATATDVDLVINNAGVLRSSGPIGEDAIAAMQYEMNVNVYGLMRVAAAFAPVLSANGGGALVQLNSVASLKAFPDIATYSASKAASYSITQSLRDVLGRQGTLVVSVHPGPIATDMANDAGLGEIAEPPALVFDAVVAALREESFHAFPDSLAKQIAADYEGFSKSVIEVAVSETGD